MFCFVICKGQCHFSYAPMWKRWIKRLYVPHIWSLNVVSDLATQLCVVGTFRSGHSFFLSLSLSFLLFLSLCGIVLWKHAGTAGLIHRERSWSKVNEKSTTLSLSCPVFPALLSFIRPVSLSFFYTVYSFASFISVSCFFILRRWCLPCAWHSTHSSLMTQFLLFMPQRRCFD